MGLNEHVRHARRRMLSATEAVLLPARLVHRSWRARAVDPSCYRVPTGTKFEFDIDYSKLARDPNADKCAAGYLYAPGAPVAVWA